MELQRRAMPKWSLWNITSYITCGPWDYAKSAGVLPVKLMRLLDDFFMKIIIVDNFNCETSSDILLAENINKYWGKKLLIF
jgi:hypothetical protein